MQLEIAKADHNSDICFYLVFSSHLNLTIYANWIRLENKQKLSKNQFDDTKLLSRKGQHSPAPFWPTHSPSPIPSPNYTCTMLKTHVKFLAFLNQLQPTVRLLLNFTTPNKCVCAHAVCVCVCVLARVFVRWFSIEDAEPLPLPLLFAQPAPPEIFLFLFVFHSKVVCQLCGFWGWHVASWCDPKQAEQQQLMPDYDDDDDER